MAKITLYALIPQLSTLLGHQYSYHVAFQEAVKGLDVTYAALIPKKTKLKETPKEWMPFFKKNRVFDYCKMLRINNLDDRIYFLESFNTKDLLNLVVSAFLFSKKKDRFWLLLRYGKGQMRKTHTFLLWLFQLLLRKKVLFLSDSELVSASYTFLKDISIIPIPHTEHRESIKRGEKLVCVWPGEPRSSKGKKEIENLYLLNDPAMTHFVLPEKFQEMERDEYINTLMKADIFLLPYDPLVYRYGTSGIFVEGVVLGKMPVVKEGSWLAYELKKHALPELIVDWNNPHFFTHLHKLANDPKIKEKLKEMQQKYRSYHSLLSYRQHLALLIRK